MGRQSHDPVWSYDGPRDATRVSTSTAFALTVPDVPRARAAAPRPVQSYSVLSSLYSLRVVAYFPSCMP
jgi:hypothetical protein